jgi:uncharacterized OB-fold protein
MSMNNAVTPLPSPEITPLTRPYWDALAQGVLQYQRCRDCGLAVLPVRTECPHCLQNSLGWERAGGRARLISWIVYHRAFHPAFAARVPYTVAIVELEEGPRLVSNLVAVDDPEALRIDSPLILTIEREEGIALPRFRPATPATSSA